MTLIAWNVGRLICVGIVLAVIVTDSNRFFSRELVYLKLRHQSGQYNWNIHFPQSVVYRNSPFRYKKDFDELKKVIVQDSLLISDFATSYYAAAILPVYIRNTQPHQGRWRSRNWASLFDKMDFCYLDNPKRMEKVMQTIRDEFSRYPGRRIYFLLNNDGVNKNNHLDCMANRSEYTAEGIDEFTTKAFTGDYLDLYLVDKSFFNSEH
jgi:hypothetical protein